MVDVTNGLAELAGLDATDESDLAGESLSKRALFRESHKSD
jgi:hypothetical protein